MVTVRSLPSILCIISILSLANAASIDRILTPRSQTKLEFSKIIGGGVCRNLGNSRESKEELAKTCNLELSRPTAVTTINCAACTYGYGSSGTAYWCVHDSTVCPDPWPWHENYQYSRDQDHWRCPAEVVVCSPWQRDGCCGSSDKSEPVCPNPNNLVCASGTVPPKP